MAKKDKAAVRRAVHTRIRRRVRGNAERPRLAIFRSLNHIYAQIIDDERAETIASASTVEKDLRGATGGNVESAQRVGRAIAERAIAKGVEQVVFDRGGFRFHGRVKALTDAAREAGLNKNERAEDAEGGEAGEGGAEAAA
jgi:large subunit ribosomal protein L18